MRVPPAFVVVALCLGCSPGTVPDPVAAPSALSAVPAGPVTGGGVAAHPAPPTPADAVEIAVTVDDLPHHGEDVGGETRLAIHQRLVAAFAVHRLPPVVGFVNARTLERHPEEEAALSAWVAAGNLLANHTYGHVDAAEVDEASFLADVDANDRALRKLAGDRPASRFFRFPYLREGKDGPGQASLRAAIRARGYRVADVTMDTWDWAYARAAARCRARGDEGAVASLREDFIDAAAYELRWADGAARELLGRPAKQILLLHASDFTAAMIDELLTVYEKNGARFVSLDEAMTDPIYADETMITANVRGNLLWRARRARGTRTPAIAPPRDALLDHVCR